MASFYSEKRQMRRTRPIVQTRFISLSLFVPLFLYCPKLKYQARSSRDVHLYSIRSCLVFVNRTMMVSSETDIASFQWEREREKRHSDSSLFSSAQNIANEMNEWMNRGWFGWQTETGQIMSLSWLFTWTILLSLGMKRDDLLNDMSTCVAGRQIRFLLAITNNEQRKQIELHLQTFFLFINQFETKERNTSVSLRWTFAVQSSFRCRTALIESTRHLIDQLCRLTRITCTESDECCQRRVEFLSSMSEKKRRQRSDRHRRCFR